MSRSGLAPVTASLQVGQFSVHTERWDGGRNGQVLLLHGLGGNSITWHGVAPIVASELGAQVLAVDFPGFGASRPGQSRINLRTLSNVVLGVMRASAPDSARWVLAGNSLGGLIALSLACQVPERVAAVSLAALALPLQWGRERQRLMGLRQYLPLAMPWQGRRIVSRYVRDRGLPGVVDDPIRLLFRDPTRLDAELRERLLGVSEYRLTWAEEAARAYEQATLSLGWGLTWPGLASRWIRDAKCPVQAIYGTHDPLFPAAAWQRLERARPDWHFVSMHDIGHVPQLEAPAEFASHLLGWLLADKQRAART